MIKNFEFYYDFASPYTYLAHKKIREIEKKNSIKIKYMPILLGGLLKKLDIKSNAEISVKKKYMIDDCKMCASKNNIEFKFNRYFPIITLNLMRCSLVAEKKGFSQNFVNKVFDAIWKDGLNLNDQTIFEKLLKNLDINPLIFLKESSDVQIKNELIKRTDHAYKKGIFGVPSYIVNNKIFWGQDRLDFVIYEANK